MIELTESYFGVEPIYGGGYGSIYLVRKDDEVYATKRVFFK